MKIQARIISILSIGLLFIACSDASRLKEALEKYVEKESKAYPRKVDDYTQLVACEYIEPNVLRYRYLVDVPTPPEDSAQVKSVMKENILRQSKIEPASKYFREKNVVFQYEYSNKDGYLFRVELTPADYKNK